MQTVESQTYFGYMIDQLAAVMADRQINFSIFSPRKMSFLYKLFEDAGGDLNHALSKNFAKDKRHLILLRGFQLQERPLSPQSTSMGEQKPTQNSPLPSTQIGGIKRPLSPSLPSTQITPSVASVTSTTNTSVVPQIPNQMNRLPHPNIGNTDISSPFPPPSKTPTSDAMVRPQARASPPVSISTWSAQSNAPTMTSVSVTSSSAPVGGSVLKGQLNMRPRVPQQIQNSGIQPGLQQTAPTLVSLVQQPPQPMPIKPNVNNTSMRQAGPQNRSQQPVSSPFPVLQAPSPSQPQPSPLPIQRAVASPMGQSVPSPMQSNQPQVQTAQQSFQQPATTISQINMNQPGFVTTPANMGQPMKEQRRRIWAGIIEYQEKPVQPPINASNRITYTLNCQISCHVVNGESEINADKWPRNWFFRFYPNSSL